MGSKKDIDVKIYAYVAMKKEGEKKYHENEKDVLVIDLIISIYSIITKTIRRKL